MILATNGIIQSKSAAAPVANDIIQTGLILNLNTRNPLSYTGVYSPWKDLTSNANNAVSTTGIAYDSTLQAFFFDGADDFFTFGTTNFPTGKADISFGMWVNTGTIPAQQNLLLHYGNFNNDPQSIIIWYQHDNKTFNVVWAANNYISTSTNFGALSTWYNVSMVYSATTSNLKFYINGNLINTSGTFNYNLPAVPDKKSLGGPYYPINLARMYMARAYFYNTALSATDVMTNFTNTKGGFGL